MWFAKTLGHASFVCKCSSGILLFQLFKSNHESTLLPRRWGCSWLKICIAALIQKMGLYCLFLWENHAFALSNSFISLDHRSLPKFNALSLPLLLVICHVAVHHSITLALASWLGPSIRVTIWLCLTHAWWGSAYVNDLLNSTPLC